MQEEVINPNPKSSTFSKPLTIIKAIVFIAVLALCSTISYQYGLKTNTAMNNPEVNTRELEPDVGCSRTHLDSSGFSEADWESSLHNSGSELIFSEVNLGSNTLCTRPIYATTEGVFLENSYHHREAGKITVIESFYKEQKAQLLIIDLKSLNVDHRIPIVYSHTGYVTATINQQNNSGLVGGIVLIKPMGFVGGCEFGGCENFGNIVGTDEKENNISIVRTDGKYINTKIEDGFKIGEGVTMVFQEKGNLRLFAGLDSLDSDLKDQLVVGEINISALDE